MKLSGQIHTPTSRIKPGTRWIGGRMEPSDGLDRPWKSIDPAGIRISDRPARN